MKDLEKLGKINVFEQYLTVWVALCMVAGVLTKKKGIEWFKNKFLAFLHPVTIIALLLALLTIFAFQADNITLRWFHVVLIAIPLLIQVYFNSSLAYWLMKLLKVPHNIAAPGALIGANNFFELAVATAIALYGPGSGAALATVVGVLVEVPVCFQYVPSVTEQSTGLALARSIKILNMERGPD